MADNRFIELFAEKELRKLYSKVYASREKYVATGLVGMHRWKRHTALINRFDFGERTYELYEDMLEELSIEYD